MSDKLKFPKIDLRGDKTKPLDLASLPVKSELDKALGARSENFVMNDHFSHIKLIQKNGISFFCIPKHIKDPSDPAKFISFDKAGHDPKKDYITLSNSEEYIKIASVDKPGKFARLLADIAIMEQDDVIKEDLIVHFDDQMAALWGVKNPSTAKGERVTVRMIVESHQADVDKKLAAAAANAANTTATTSSTAVVTTTTTTGLGSVASAVGTTAPPGGTVASPPGGAGSTASGGPGMPKILNVDPNNSDAQKEAAKQSKKDNKAYEKSLEDANDKTERAKIAELKSLAELTETAVLAHLDARIAVLHTWLMDLIAQYNAIIDASNNGTLDVQSAMSQMTDLRNSMIGAVAHIKLLLDETKLTGRGKKRVKFDRELCSILTSLGGSFGRKKKFFYFKRYFNTIKGTSAYNSDEFKVAYKAAKKGMILGSNFTSIKDKNKAQGWLNKNTSTFGSWSNGYNPGLSGRAARKAAKAGLVLSAEGNQNETSKKTVGKDGVEVIHDYMKYPTAQLLNEYNAIDPASNKENNQSIRIAVAKRILLEMTQQTNEANQVGADNKPYFFTMVDQIGGIDAFWDLLGDHILSGSDWDWINSEYSANKKLQTGKNGAGQSVESVYDPAGLTGSMKDKLLVNLFTRKLSDKIGVPYSAINKIYSADESDGGVIDASTVAGRISGAYKGTKPLGDESLINRHTTAGSLIANGLESVGVDGETAIRRGQKTNRILSGTSDILKAGVVISGVVTGGRMLRKLFKGGYKRKGLGGQLKDDLWGGTFSPAKLLLLQGLTKVGGKGFHKAWEDSWADKLLTATSKEGREKSRQQERIKLGLGKESESHESTIYRTIGAQPVRASMSMISEGTNGGIVLDGDAYFAVYPSEKEGLDESGQKALLNRIAQTFADRYGLDYAALAALASKSGSLNDILQNREQQKNKIQPLSSVLIGAGLYTQAKADALLSKSNAEIDKEREKMAFAAIMYQKALGTRKAYFDQLLPTNNADAMKYASAVDVFMKYSDTATGQPISALYTEALDAYLNPNPTTLVGGGMTQQKFFAGLQYAIVYVDTIHTQSGSSFTMLGVNTPRSPVLDYFGSNSIANIGSNGTPLFDYGTKVVMDGSTALTGYTTLPASAVAPTWVGRN